MDARYSENPPNIDVLNVKTRSQRFHRFWASYHFNRSGNVNTLMSHF